MKKKTSKAIEALIAEFQIPQSRESGDLRMIRRLLVLSMNRRTHFLRRKRKDGGNRI